MLNFWTSVRPPFASFMTMATAEAGDGGGSPPSQPDSHPSATRNPPQQENPQPATTPSAATSSAATANARAQAVNAVTELPMAHNSYDELSLIGNGKKFSYLSRNWVGLGIVLD